jgi:hypothetical protein
MNRTVLNLIAAAESSGGPAPLARQCALPEPGNMIVPGTGHSVGGADRLRKALNRHNFTPGPWGVYRE